MLQTFKQGALFDSSEYEKREPRIVPDLTSYDRILVAFSGGKDSIGCFLELLSKGVPKEKIELHHHLVDGREGSTLFDWPCTEDYCRQFAQAFNVPIYFSWLEGGFEREILKENAPKAPTHFETPDGVMTSGGKGKNNTRLMFPAKSNDLTKRWCSPYLKIDVMQTLICNQDRFQNSRTLILIGERAEESSKRAEYSQFEQHRADRREGKLKRHVDTWRPVHQHSTAEVWKLLEEHHINPHPAYRMGWGRLSCRACIFGSPNQWASNYIVAPMETGQLEQLERELDFTIDAKESIRDMASRGEAYPGITSKLIQLAMSREFYEPIRLDAESWQLPSGAFGEMNGPS